MSEFLNRVVRKKLPQHRRAVMVFLFAFVPILGLLIALIQDEVFTDFEGNMLYVWVVCTLVLALADLMTDSRDEAGWSGYLNLTVMVIWLSLGLGATLFILFMAGVVSFALRFSSLTPIILKMLSLGHIRQNTIVQIALTGVALIVTDFVFNMLDGDFPTAAFNGNNLAPIFPVFVALTIGITALLFMEQLIYTRKSTPKYFLVQRFGWQLISLVVVPAMALVYVRAGAFPFVALMGMLAVQIVRYQQINNTRRSLVQKVNHLSALNSLAEHISTSLVTRDVLQNIYDSVRNFIDVSAFYIALHDSNHHRVEFPIVFNGTTSIDLPPRSTDDFKISDHIVDQKTILNFNRDQLNQTNSMMPMEFSFEYFYGLPFMVETKIVGVMGVMTDSLLTDLQQTTLRNIASQASLAIRNTTLYSRSVDLAANLSLINESVQQIMFNLDNEEALNIACQAAIQIVSADKAIIFWRDAESQEPLSIVLHQGITESHLQLYEDEQYLPTLQYEEIAVTDDVLKLPEDDLLRLAGDVGGFRTIVEVPLTSGKIAMGQLSLFHIQPHVYEDTKIRLLESLAYQITAALDNADLLKSLEMYASEQAQLVQLSRITTSSLNLETSVDGVTTMLQHMLNTERVTLGLLEQDHLQLHGYVGTVASSLVLDDVPELYAMRTQFLPRIFYRDDELLSVELQTFMDDHEDVTLNVLPMVANDNLLGMVMLHQTSKRVFSDGEWRFLEMATNQISTQLHNAQVFANTHQSLNKRLRELSVIEEIAQKISGATNTDELLRYVLDAVSRATESHFAAIGLLNSSGDMRILSQELNGGKWTDYQELRNLEGGLMRQVAHTGKLLVVPDNRHETAYITVDNGYDYLSSLIVPLIIDGASIGAFNLEHTQSNYYKQEHIDFARSVAGHAVISIKTARLLKERQNQVETLTSLRDLTVRLAMDSATTTETAIEGILRTALDILDGHSGVMFLNDVENNQVISLKTLHNDNHRGHDTVIEIPDSIIEHTIATGEIQVIEDVHQNSEFKGRRGYELGYASLIIAPIKRGDRVREVLCVTSHQAGAFSNTDRDNLDILTIQAAGHIDNVALIQRLRTFGNRVQAILETTRDGIILLDTENNLIEANASAEKLLELTLENVKQENFVDFILNGIRTGDINDDVEVNGLQEMARFLRLRPQEITTRPLQIRAGNNIRYIKEIGSPVVDSQNKLVGRLLTLRDVTEEKLLEVYRDEITHMVVHDLRSPLGTITSSINLSLDLIDESNDELLKATIVPALGVSIDSASSLLDLVDTILDIAKMETRRMTLKRAEHLLSTLVTTAHNHLGQSLAEANIKIDINVPSDLPHVDVDGEKIRRVIINLMDNAIRYSSPQKGHIQVSAQQYLGNKILVTIADNGRGIPPEESDLVFEKFRQIKSSQPRGRKGSGVGLTFCRLAVEAHGEQIWVEQQNRPLSGACIAFTLPIYVSHDFIPEDELNIPLPETISS